MSFSCNSTLSNEISMENLGVNLVVYSGESSTGNHQAEDELAAGSWELMKGSSEQTIFEVLLWTPEEVALGKSGLSLDMWGDVRLSDKDVFELKNGDETTTMEEEGSSILGGLEEERTGTFTLSFRRDDVMVASATRVFLSNPSLHSHIEDGDVFKTDGVLTFELLDIEDFAEYNATWWIVIVCGEGHVYSKYQHDMDATEIVDSKLNWDLDEIYVALTLTETSECVITLTEHSFGEADPAFGHSGPIEGYHTRKFTTTFIKE